jgi:hypothetical protein
MWIGLKKLGLNKFLHSLLINLLHGAVALFFTKHKFRSSVHNSLPLDPILNQMNRVHTISIKSTLILFSHLRLGLASYSFQRVFLCISQHGELTKAQRGKCMWTSLRKRVDKGAGNVCEPLLASVLTKAQRGILIR